MKFISVRWLTIGMIASLTVPVYAMAEIDMVEGEWESTLELQEGQKALSPSTWKECLSQHAPAPSLDSGQFDECRIKEQNIAGNTVSWHVVCSERGRKMKGKGEVTFHGDKYVGTLKLKFPNDSSGMSTEVKISGQRLDPCAESGNSQPTRAMEINKVLVGQKTTLQKARSFWDGTKKSPLEK